LVSTRVENYHNAWPFSPGFPERDKRVRDGPSNVQNVQECDATNDNRNTGAGYIKNFFEKDLWQQTNI
jgi:hypothetical protein